MALALKAAVLMIALGVCATASADPAVVEDLIRQANELRKQGADHKAMPLLRKAYDLERSPRTAAQLGLVEAQLGYWLAAEKHLTEALSTTRSPWLAKHETQLRQTLQNVRASIGEVEIKGTPAGAEVVVNGQPAGKLPLSAPVRVPDGAVQITLRAPGHAEASTSLVVTGGQRVPVSLALEPVGAATAAAPVAAPAATTAPSDEPDRGKATPVEDRPASWIRPASWVAMVGAAAALGVGAYGLKNQRDRGREFDYYMTPGTQDRPCHLDAASKGGETCKSLYNKMKAGERLAIVGFAAGGVLLTGAVLGLILGPSSAAASEPQDEYSWSIQIAPASAGANVNVGWSLRF